VEKSSIDRPQRRFDDYSFSPFYPDMPSSPLAQHDVAQVASQFAIQGEWERYEPLGNGLINDTYAVFYNQAGIEVRYVIQRINHHVFKQPELVMENIQRVTQHIKRKLKAAGEADVIRKVLSLVPTHSQKRWYVDEAGNTWRCYIFVEGADAHDHVDSPVVAEEAAKAFGHFQALLVDLEEPRLADTIPNFHNTRSRYDAFEAACAADLAGRAASIASEIAWVRQREPLVDVLLDLHKKNELPERVTHNDTKINNVMMDRETGEGLCVMDLDTVMPGLVLYDFGDLVRATAISTAEDSLELDKVVMRMPMFQALVRGFLAGAKSFLTETERQYLPFSGKLITLETGIRFLTDYLNGDTYFKIKRPQHNLDRFRVQAKLVESIEAQEPAMEAYVASLA
jgi:hypothetical protein